MKAKDIRWQEMVLVYGTLLLAVLVGSVLWAQVPKKTPAGIVPPGMLKAYGSAVNWGEYEGTLYCLRHDFSLEKKDQEICQREGRHRHALVMADGHVHPLYGQTEELDGLINAADINAKRVKVRGKYYPVTNAILVGSITVLEK